VNPWLILAAVLAVGAAGGAGYVKGRGDGQAKVQAAWDAERIQQQEAHNQALRESIEKQQALQLGADQLRQEANREKRELAARNTALTNSLRDRPERPTTEVGAVRNAAGAGSGGCTPRELYRQDSEVVVGLAREADEVLIALKQCYAQYDAVRLKLGGGATAGK
jgi:uncharacterized membrane protein